MEIPENVLEFLDLKKVECLRPRIPKKCHTLILGTCPGSKSIEDKFYYMDSRNRFWHIMREIFRLEDNVDPKKVLKEMNDQGYGLWDVVKTCYRKGSSDSTMLAVQTNDIPRLLQRHPSISHIIFNGQRAEELIRKDINHLEQRFTVVKSTSSLNNRYKVKRLGEWKDAIGIR